MQSSPIVPGQPSTSETELPLRILERDGAPLVRCLCGAELAGARGHHLSQEISAAGLIRMVLHAKNCRRAQGALF